MKRKNSNKETTSDVQKRSKGIGAKEQVPSKHIYELPILCLENIFKHVVNKLSWAYTSRYFSEIAETNLVRHMCTSTILPSLMISYCLKQTQLNPLVPYKSVYCAKRTKTGAYDLTYRLPEKVLPRNKLARLPIHDLSDIFDHGDGIGLVCRHFNMPGIVVFETSSSFVFAFTDCLGELLMLPRVAFIKAIDNRIVVIDKNTYQFETELYNFCIHAIGSCVGPFIRCDDGSMALPKTIFHKTEPIFIYKKDSIDKKCMYKGGEDVLAFEILALDIGRKDVEFSETNVAGPTPLYYF